VVSLRNRLMRNISYSGSLPSLSKITLKSSSSSSLLSVSDDSSVSLVIAFKSSWSIFLYIFFRIYTIVSLS
jgi:hypothetical protein